VKRIRPAEPADAPAIAEIYNQGIAERRATFETAPRSAAEMAARIADADRHLTLVACDAEGRILGWAGVAPHSARQCYVGIGEASVYLQPQARGQGLGRALLEALVGASRLRGYWKLVSRIFPDNRASRALCASCGFREVGTYQKHAQLDGRWEDVVIVERLIPENQAAVSAVANPEACCA
jgi:L-amino acid N-acyltransferase YncA